MYSLKAAQWKQASVEKTSSSPDKKEHATANEWFIREFFVRPVQNREKSVYTRQAWNNARYYKKLYGAMERSKKNNN